MARGFAHSGVLRALNEAKIPIGAIYGTEMGAFMGTLYGMSGNNSGFEWALLKFKNHEFYEKQIFSALMKEPTDGSRLEDELHQTLGSKNLKDAKIPVHLIVESNQSQDVDMIDEGDAAKALRAAFPVQGLMKAADWNGTDRVAALTTRPCPVVEARRLGIGPVVVVDLLSDGARAAANASEEEKLATKRMLQARSNCAKDLETADLVITPALSGIGYFDFKKRTDIAFRGKRAVTAQLNSLRRLAGLAAPDAIDEKKDGQQ
jgi:NTE family protein